MTKTGGWFANILKKGSTRRNVEIGLQERHQAVHRNTLVVSYTTGATLE